MEFGGWWYFGGADLDNVEIYKCGQYNTMR